MPRVPGGSVAGEMVKLGQFTDSVKAFSPKQLLASVARNVTGKLPVTFGVPEMIPAGESVKLVGNEPPLMLQEMEPMPPV